MLIPSCLRKSPMNPLCVCVLLLAAEDRASV